MLRNLPFRQKLMLIILVTTVVVMLLMRGASFVFEVAVFRNAMVRQLSTLGEVIASNSSAALAFQNQDDAREILSAIRAERHVEAAALYDANGHLFSVYPESLAADAVAVAPEEDGYRFMDSSLIGFQPVMEKDRRLGTLYLKLDTGVMMREWVLGSIQIALAVMAFVLLVAYALSRVLQRQISAPILSLADNARVVSDLHDYSVRAVKHGNDEVGMLTDAFNQMLEQIEQQNEALKESESRARGIMNAAMSAVIVIDTSGRVVEWNARAERMFDRPRAEALGQELAELIIPPRHREAHRRGMAHFHSTGKGPVLNRTIELSALRRDGAEFPVELSIIPLRSGDVVTFCGFITDITERKESEARIRESLKDITDLKAALDVHAIVAITDPQGKITYVNDKFCAISKYSREELLGQDHRIINSGHHPKEFFRDLWTTIAQGRVWQGEIKNRAKDGTIYWVDTTIVPFIGPNGKPYQYVAVRADITERKRVEEQLHNLNLTLERHVAERTAQLELANKELEAFSYSVSHDLRAPLRHIDGFAGLLLKSDGPLVSERGRRHLDHIADAAKQMGTLIDDLLVFSRMGRSEMRITMVDLNKLVEETIHALRLETHERNIRWIRGDLPVVRGDLPMLRQVFINLLSNSVKYTRPRNPAVIEIGYAADSNGEFVFHVRDNGVGFEMEYVHKLFGVFQRLHRAEDFEGTGIGLANVRRIVTRHGGRTWAEGKPDHGATVYFTLPKTPPTQS